jgi:RNA polymerase sigma-70 factor, ECF subfamily
MEQFVHATQRDVWRFVAHLSNVRSADDLVQDTYVRALGSLHRFEGRSSARVWLLSIARRVAADHIRTARVRPRHADVLDWQSAAERAQPTGTPGFDEGIALADLVGSLHPDQRDAFVLTQTLGLSYADTAAICGCPIGTIRSRIARARDDLVTALRDTDHTSI